MAECTDRTEMGSMEFEFDDIVPGQLVYSKAGHDRGRVYVVMKITDNGVWLADGRTRTIQKPKYKNRKHIQKLCCVLTEAAAYENLAPAEANSRIRRAVRMYSVKETNGEDRECRNQM